MRSLIIEKFAASKRAGWANEPTLTADAKLRSAAVLVPLIDRSAGMTVLLTQRTHDLPHHAGQISFPGGSTEHADADPVATALRETEEEIGLPPGRVEVVGFLPASATGTGFYIVPVVGIVTPEFPLELDKREVEEVFEVPLQFVLDPSRHHLQTATIRGRELTYYVLDYPGRNIWGATAGILVKLYRQLVENSSSPAAPNSQLRNT